VLPVSWQSLAVSCDESYSVASQKRFAVGSSPDAPVQPSGIKLRSLESKDNQEVQVET
jgi:hypothetical protein